MGKDKRATTTESEAQSETSQTSENFLNGQRSPEREALANAIAAAAAVTSEAQLLRDSLARAKDDAFRARRAVEEAERHLAAMQDARSHELVGAYTSGEEFDDSALTAARLDLIKATTRRTDLELIERELSARSPHGPPGSRVPALQVTEAVRAVVKTHPTVRRLAQDFAVAQRAFREYESTLIWLAGLGCIPEDLQEAAPKAHHTRWADPDPTWKAAVEALKHDADAPLPE